MRHNSVAVSHETNGILYVYKCNAKALEIQNHWLCTVFACATVKWFNNYNMNIWSFLFTDP